MSSPEFHRSVAELEIETLALSELKLAERIVDLEAEVSRYRELALAALDAVHHLTIERQRLREELDDLAPPHHPRQAV
jgi:hypothetical protein